MTKQELRDYVSGLTWMVGITQYAKRPGQDPNANPVEYNITVVSEGQYENSSDSIIGRAFVLNDGQETEDATLSDAVGKWIAEKAPPPATPVKDAARDYFNGKIGAANPSFPNRTIRGWDSLQVNEIQQIGQVRLVEEVEVNQEVVTEYTIYSVRRDGQNVVLRRINQD